jgi:hypothetical protein
MTRLTILVLAAVALLGTATGILRSHSLSTIGATGTASMPTLQELNGATGTDKLPVEDFEDRSLVYPRETKH